MAVKFAFFNTREKQRLLKWVLQAITYTTAISAVFACLEFVASNLFNYNLNDYLPRPSEEEAAYNAYALDLFYRARAFAPESGHFAFMMELFFPFAIYLFIFFRLQHA